MVTALGNVDDEAYLMLPELLHRERHACKAFWRTKGAPSLDSRDRAGAFQGIRRRFIIVRSDATELMGL